MISLSEVSGIAPYFMSINDRTMRPVLFTHQLHQLLCTRFFPVPFDSKYNICSLLLVLAIRPCFILCSAPCPYDSLPSCRYARLIYTGRQSHDVVNFMLESMVIRYVRYVSGELYLYPYFALVDVA